MFPTWHPWQKISKDIILLVNSLIWLSNTNLRTSSFFSCCHDFLLLALPLSHKACPVLFHLVPKYMFNTKYSKHQFFYFPILILTKNLGSKKTLFMRRERLQCSGLGFGYRGGNLSKLWISRKADYLKEWIIHYLRTNSLSHWFTLSLAGQISLFVAWPRHAIISPCSSIGFLLRGW